MDVRSRAARVRAILAAALTIALLLAALPLAATQESAPAAQALFSGDTFVGETSDPDTFVAIVLGGAEGDDSRPARGYLCNGLLRTVDVWLEGEVAGDQLILSADDGSQLTGIVNPAGIGGVASLSGGDALLFTAAPATGLAGLYTVEMLPGGRLQGGSAAGATLVGAQQAAGPEDAGRFVYEAMATLPDGETLAIEVSAGTTEEGTFRAIILPDGRAQGQGKTKRGTGWVDPDSDPRR